MVFTTPLQPIKHHEFHDEFRKPLILGTKIIGHLASREPPSSRRDQRIRVALQSLPQAHELPPNINSPSDLLGYREQFDQKYATELLLSLCTERHGGNSMDKLRSDGYGPNLFRDVEAAHVAKAWPLSGDELD